jgi:hypothetical protein
MFLLNQGVNPLSSSLWAHVLQTRDLIVLQNKRSGFEVYNPHFLARQFGLLQYVPLPLSSLPMYHGIEGVLLPMKKLKL